MKELTNAQLTYIYNEVSPRTIKKFCDYNTATERTRVALEKAGMTYWFQDDNLVVGKIENKPKKPRAKANFKPRTSYTDDMFVHVVVDKNPKNQKSKARARFDLYKSGMTVVQYKEACVKLEGDKARKPHQYLADLHYDVKHSYILVSEETETAS